MSEKPPTPPSPATGAAMNQPRPTPNRASFSTERSEPSGAHQRRLLVISTGLALGGAELMLLRLLRALRPQGFTPEVIALTPRGALKDEFIAAGIPVTELNFKGGIAEGARSLFQLTRLIRRRQPELIQTWMYHANLIGGILARLFSAAPCVWSIRHSTTDRRTTSLSTRLVVKAGATLSGVAPTAIISCSQEAIDVHASMGYCRSKMAYIPNGFDAELYRPDGDARKAVRDEFSIPSSAPLVGMFGRYHPQKNFAGFCEVAERILSRHPETFFIAAGTDVTASNQGLAQMIEQHRIGAHLRLVGPRRDMPRLLASLDALVSTSLYGEAFPNVIAEAMLCGVPCVGFNVGDTKSIISDAGYTIPLGDIEMMTDKLSLIIAAPPYQPHFAPLAVRRSVAERFSIEAVAKQYAALYSALINGSAPIEPA
jgi:glycosyltransferase involved in cell wall biosynthesis